MTSSSRNSFDKSPPTPAASSSTKTKTLTLKTLKMAIVDILSLYTSDPNSSFLHNLTNCVDSTSHNGSTTTTTTTTQLDEFSAIFKNISHQNVGPLFLSSNLSEVFHQCLRGLLPSVYYSSPYLLPVWQQVTWCVLFGLMVAVASCGNAIVIWIVLAHRRMRNVTNYFLLNLALADLAMSILNAVFNFVYVLESNWPFGSIYCTLNNFVSNLAVASSVFSISAMSIDRYFAIVYPLSPRMSRKSATALVTFIWFSATLLSLPTLLYSSTVTYRYPDGNLRTLCYMKWPDGLSGVSYMDYVYNILFLLLTYMVPMLCMAYTYTSMCSVLWGSKSIGAATERQQESIRSKQRIVRMLVTVVIIFASCWLPYHCYFLYSYHNPQVQHAEYIQHLFLAIYWLAMSNSMYNPIIYYTMNNRFRGYFHTVFCFWRKSNRPSNSRRWMKRGHLVEFRKSFSSTQTSLRVTLSGPFGGNPNPGSKTGAMLLKWRTSFRSTTTTTTTAAAATPSTTTANFNNNINNNEQCQEV